MDSLASYTSDGEDSNDSNECKMQYADRGGSYPRRSSDANYDPVQMDMSEESNNNNSSGESGSERANSPAIVNSHRGARNEPGRSYSSSSDQRRSNHEIHGSNSRMDDDTRKDRSNRHRNSSDKQQRGSDDNKNRRSTHDERRKDSDHRGEDRRELKKSREDERRARDEDRRKERSSSRSNKEEKNEDREKVGEKDHHHRDDRRDRDRRRERDRDRRHPRDERPAKDSRNKEEQRVVQQKEKEKDKEKDKDKDKEKERARSRSRSRSRDHVVPPFRTMSYREEKSRNKLAQLEKLGIELKPPEGDNPQPNIPVQGEQNFYNPLATASQGKYAEQIQKRKLLWANKSKPEEGRSASSAAGTANTWVGTTFTHDQDGKVTAKFKRLMGIKGDLPASVPAAGAKPEILKKQEEMFSNMEQQYEVARATTHTQRGVGFGYATGGYQFPR